MKRLPFYYILIFLQLLFSINSYASDTLCIKEATGNIVIYNYISILEDSQKTMDIGEIIKIKDNYSFYSNKDRKLNFEYSRSTFWLRLIIKNDAKISLNYIMEISNPDLNYISIYDVQNDSVLRTINTGELLDVRSREIYNRNFLFHVFIEQGENHTYYISVNNNGHPCSIPVRLIEKTHFEKYDNKTDIFNWAIYGLLIFIVIFNMYLYLAIKDKVNLYYSLSLFFAILTFLHYEGYLYFVNPPQIVENIKWINPSLYCVFLLLFTQSFVSINDRYKSINRIINPLKYFVLIAPIAYNLNYPFSLIADIGIPVLVLIAFIFIIIMAVASFKRDYLPSHLFLLAYIFVFLGLLIHQLKEFDLINPNFFVINSIKTGLTLQNILLTIAVLERFRFNQENDKQTIHDNLLKIEIQNKELEIINTELEKLSIVASETDNSIAIYDNNGRLEWGNAGFEKLYEVPINELIKNDRDKIELIIPNEKISWYVNKCRESKLPVVFETPVLTKNKQVLWIQTTLSPFIRSGKIFKIIAIDSDITSLKTYEKELETAKERAVESDRLKTAFLGNMSHEIRTPLNGIMGFSQLLNENELSKEEIGSYLEIIKTCGEQLIRIIDDVLDISLIESNQLKIYPEVFDLKSFMREIVDFFETYKKTVDKAHIVLVSEMKIEDEHRMIISDPFRLKQVISNLIRNGLKFTNEGQIKIVTYQKEHFLHFYVEDTGIGIDPAKKNIIFERFRQGEESLSRKYGGTGLGLSISKGIVNKLGGDIWIDTTYKNGLRICFTIPLVISGKEIFLEEQHIELIDIEEKIRDKDILIVEDHDFSFKYFEEILLPFKPKLSRAINGEEAVEMVRNNHYDLILMDINLPIMDGVAATKEIRRFSPDLPIFVQTAYAMESEVGMIMASGCNDLMSKPIDKMEFFEKLLKHL